MSGIAAVVDTRRQLQPGRFRAWARTLEQIGPHGLSVWSSDEIAMAHARLRIFREDDSFRQPATLGNGVHVIADARLDAVAELRRELQSSGLPVRARAGDAELMLHAYAVWGDSFLEHLLGDFAVVVWDERREKLLAAVDHFGVRRLYCAPVAGGLVISNWGATVHAHADVDRSPDDAAVVNFLQTGTMPPEATAFAGVRMLPAAHRLEWTRGGIAVTRYWSPPVEESLRYRDPRAYQEELSQLLAAAVADRSRGLSVAVLLSGGVDSPAIAAVAQAQRGTSRVTGHSSIFEYLIPDDEERYVTAVAQHLGLEVTFHAADDYPPYGRADELADLSLVPVNSPFAEAFERQLQAASADASILLTGHGTDAILAPEPVAALATGPERAQLLRVVQEASRHAVRYRRRPPLGLLPSLALLRRARPSAARARPPWLRQELAGAGDVPDALDRVVRQRRSEAYRVTSGRWIPRAVAGFTPFAQRAHMECAHPFLDLRIVRFCLRLPAIPWCWDKHVLRTAFRDRLPEPVLLRRKTPLQGDVLRETLSRVGFDWLSPLAPGDLTSRYYGWPDFVPLAELMRNDPDWLHSRPIALDFFWRTWSARSRS